MIQRPGKWWQYPWGRPPNPPHLCCSCLAEERMPLPYEGWMVYEGLLLRYMGAILLNLAHCVPQMDIHMAKTYLCGHCWKRQNRPRLWPFNSLPQWPMIILFFFLIWNLLSNWFPYNTQCSSQQVPSSIPITHPRLPPTPHQPSVCSQFLRVSFVLLNDQWSICKLLLGQNKMSASYNNQESLAWSQSIPPRSCRWETEGVKKKQERPDQLSEVGSKSG